MILQNPLFATILAALSSDNPTVQSLVDQLIVATRLSDPNVQTTAQKEVDAINQMLVGLQTLRFEFDALQAKLFNENAGRIRDLESQINRMRTYGYF